MFGQTLAVVSRTEAGGGLQTDGALEVADIVKAFPNAGTVVNHVSLTVRSGEFISLIGPSGCGKTTLLNMIAGLVPFDEGRIILSGAVPRAGRRDIAYMLARDSLLPWATALANTEFGAEIRGMPKASRRERALRLLEQVGLKGFENAHPKVLSQGMRQRVALARTFCLDATTLLMDEPFGALDAQTKIQLEEVLLALWNRERRTVLFVTHDLGEAIALSDRIIVMSARPATIIADIAIDLSRPRSARALQRNPRYHELYAEVWAKLESALDPA
jgi:NitT/TauT family transport system ATP-binding protein